MSGNKIKYSSINNKVAFRIAVGIFLFHLLLLKIFNYDEVLKAVINNGLQTIECLLATLFLFITSREFNKTSEKQSSTWILFSIATIFYATGNLIWTITEAINSNVPFPYYSDIGFILFYVFFIWGVFNFPMIPLRKTEKGKLILDLFIILISSLLVFATGIYEVILNRICISFCD